MFYRGFLIIIMPRRKRVLETNFEPSHREDHDEEHGEGLCNEDSPGGYRPVCYGIKSWKPLRTRDVTKNHLHVDHELHIMLRVSSFDWIIVFYIGKYVF